MASRNGSRRLTSITKPSPLRSAAAGSRYGSPRTPRACASTCIRANARKKSSAERRSAPRNAPEVRRAMDGGQAHPPALFQVLAHRSHAGELGEKDEQEPERDHAHREGEGLPGVAAQPRRQPAADGGGLATPRGPAARLERGDG